jgi:hypothetical protein
MPDTRPPLLYAIWIPGAGWWKLGGATYFETRRDVAVFYAGLIGHRARVQPCDKQLENGQPDLLALERERNDGKLWARIIRWWKAHTAHKAP